MKTGKLLTAGVVITSLLLGGCATTYRYDEPVVRVAPPPPYVEYVGAPPVVGHVWITGNWNWGGSRYVWVPGRWEAPRPGYQWVPHRWERDGDRWRQSGGRWEHGGGHPQAHAAPRSDHRDRDYRSAPQAMRPEPPRAVQREAPHVRPEHDARGWREHRPNAERNVTAPISAPVATPAPAPTQAPREVRPQHAAPPVIARVEAPRAPERNDVRPSPERSRGAESGDRGGHGGGREDRSERDKKRSEERGGERSQRDERR
jgi:hypothetical protein